MAYNKKNIAIYGSCISKDPFTTAFNENYKERYNCIINDQKHSFISTMQKPENVNYSELFIEPDNSANRFLSKCIFEDFEKTFIKEMLNNKIDYLVFDVNFEVERGVICFDDNKYITKITDMEKTDYYKKMSHVKEINITDNPKQFFDLWKVYCDKFFDFLREYCPQTKIVLAQVRALDVVQREDLSVYVESGYTDKIKLNNYYYKQLEEYIISKYDVDVIRFDKDTVLKEKHRWGKFYVHYDDDYYLNFMDKFNKIVDFYDLKEELSELKKNVN